MQQMPVQQRLMADGDGGGDDYGHLVIGACVHFLVVAESTFQSSEQQEGLGKLQGP